MDLFVCHEYIAASLCVPSESLQILARFVVHGKRDEGACDFICDYAGVLAGSGGSQQCRKIQECYIIIGTIIVVVYSCCHCVPSVPQDVQSFLQEIGLTKGLQSTRPRSHRFVKQVTCQYCPQYHSAQFQESSTLLCT